MENSSSCLYCPWPCIWAHFSFYRNNITSSTFANAVNDNNKKDSWIIVPPSSVPGGEIEYYKSLNLKIIISDTENFLDYLGTFSSSIHNSVEVTDNPFPEYSIPSHTEIEHRSIKNFYQGAAPIWSDIYSSRVTKLRFYSVVEELINKGKNVLITGGPATGKTTLLMQIAAFYNFNGVKLFISDISKAKGQTISSKIADAPVLLFVDNLQTSIDALNLLSQKANIKMVIAERDYAYLSSSNANFLRKNIEIVDITELDDKDSQTVIENIPIDIKLANGFTRHGGDSLFELVESNCHTPTINQRFNNVLDELRKKDDKLVQLFLLACYLHMCRSITSMDVMSCYFGTDNIQELYSLIKILSSSLSEYVGALAEDNEDYFTIRSNLLAESISEIAQSKDLAKMLTKFHNNVPRCCVPNFDAFKRRAYDARLFNRAFPNVNEGENVYDIIYQKHPSPFNLQQKALYLSLRGNYQLAFEVIDEAIAKGGSKNWSIKNSDAIIKFKANINRDDCSDVRNALDESMAALEQCHLADVRKVFHAMSYANQSLKYWYKYRDSKAITYLEKSKEWLSEEGDRDNKMRNVYRLLNKINQALNSAG